METRNRKKKRLMESQIQYIPEEVIAQILSGLPAKSLVRFKCVCKTWLSLISNMKGQERSFFHLKRYDDKGDIHFYTADKDLVVQELPSPFQIYSPQKNFRFLGSCNGLLLFSVSTCIYLWNPTTRCCKEVLHLNLLTDNFRTVASGLCFDDSTNDYKVVIRLQNWTMGDKFVLVGSLKTKKWSEIDFPYAMARSGCYVNGCLHWIVEEKIFGPDLIVYFDAKAQEFIKLPVPDDVYNIRELGVVDGCLSMGEITIESKILIMKEYGVKESWTLIWKGEPQKKRKVYQLPGIDPQSSTNSERLLVAKFRYLWGIVVWDLKLNLKENSVQMASDSVSDNLVWETYVESLAPIYGKTPDISRQLKTFRNNIRWLPKSKGKRRD